MKIIITVHSYSPNNDGVQFVTKYLAEGLVKNGNQVTVVTYLYPNIAKVKNEVINGVEVIRWNARTTHTFHRGDKKGYQKFILENQNKYDVMVNVGTQTALTDWLFPISSKITIPRLLYIHSIWDFKITKDNCRNVNALLSKLWANVRWSVYYNLNGNKIREYSIVTQLHDKDATCEFFRKKYGINSQIMENAADDIFFDESIDDTIDLPDKYLLNVSNYNERKNQRVFIEAFFKSEIPNDWNLILIGSKENEYSQLLRNLEKKLRSELSLLENEKKIYILSEISRPSISTYVKKAEIYVMSSTWEAFPISLIEAMAAGVPFISTDVGIVKYLAGGVIANSSEELKEKITSFVSDEKRRKKFGAAGKKEAIERYQISDKVNQLEKYLKEITR
ncbi:MAG: glycosyltransferase family 4 protein [Erysipelotrichaceae bacterium]